MSSIKILHSEVLHDEEFSAVWSYIRKHPLEGGSSTLRTTRPFRTANSGVRAWVGMAGGGGRWLNRSGWAWLGAVSVLPGPVDRAGGPEVHGAGVFQARVVAEYQAAPARAEGRGAAVRGPIPVADPGMDFGPDGQAPPGSATPRRPHRATGPAGSKDEPGRLRAENRRLTRELARSLAVAEIMGKLPRALGDHLREHGARRRRRRRDEHHFRRPARRGSAHLAGLRAGGAGAGHPLPPRPEGRCTARSRPG